MSTPFEIDSGANRGGGQAFRINIGLAALTGKSVHIYNIRRGRGLYNLDPIIIDWLANACQARVQGAYYGSTEVWFEPGGDKTRTAPTLTEVDLPSGQRVLETTLKIGFQPSGLVLQALLPFLLFSSSTSRYWTRSPPPPLLLTIDGATHFSSAPTIDYVAKVLVPNLTALFPGRPRERPLLEVTPSSYGVGAQRSWTTIKTTPVSFLINPLERGATLEAFTVPSVSLSSISKSKFKFDATLYAPPASTEILREALLARIQKHLPHCPCTDIEINVDDSGSDARWYVLVILDVANGYRAGSDAYWSDYQASTEMVLPQKVAEDLCQRAVSSLLLDFLDGGMRFDERMRDQICVFMGLAEGMSTAKPADEGDVSATLLRQVLERTGNGTVLEKWTSLLEDRGWDVEEVMKIHLPEIGHEGVSKQSTKDRAQNTVIEKTNAIVISHINDVVANRISKYQSQVEQRAAATTAHRKAALETLNDPGATFKRLAKVLDDMDANIKPPQKKHKAEFSAKEHTEKKLIKKLDHRPHANTENHVKQAREAGNAPTNRKRKPQDQTTCKSNKVRIVERVTQTCIPTDQHKLVVCLPLSKGFDPRFAEDRAKSSNKSAAARPQTDVAANEYIPETLVLSDNDEDAVLEHKKSADTKIKTPKPKSKSKTLKPQVQDKNAQTMQMTKLQVREARSRQADSKRPADDPLQPLKNEARQARRPEAAGEKPKLDQAKAQRESPPKAALPPPQASPAQIPKVPVRKVTEPAHVISARAAVANMLGAKFDADGNCEGVGFVAR